MSIDLSTKFLPYVDELFTTESKSALLTNTDFNFDGANTVKIRQVSTSEMTNYGRNGAAAGNWSRYGAPSDLNTTLETFTLANDRAFTFVIDRLDENETESALSAATALARQLREVVVPEVDNYMLRKIVANAGTCVFNYVNENTIYNDIINGSKVLDDNEVYEDGRVLVVTPSTLQTMKKNPTIVMETAAGSETVRAGTMGMIDGMTVIKVPEHRVPEDFAFMLVHPCATVGVQKLADYRIHENPPGISGSLVEGRIVYDCFTLASKKNAIYVHMKATYTEIESPTGSPKEQGYYEKTGEGYNAYTLSTDTSVKASKTYYKKG